MKRLYVLLMFLFFIGCKAEYEDVSNEAEYSILVNNKYKVLRELSVQGINLGDNKRKEIDVYKVSKKPGSAGRYVINKFDLKSGNQIRIKKVLRCKNCFPTKIVFSIDILLEGLNLNKPIQLVNLSVKNDEGKLIMDPLFFEEIASFKSE